MLFISCLSFLTEAISHRLIDKSELNMLVLVQFFDGLEFPHKHEVDVGRDIQMHQPILSVLFVKLPQEVDWIFLDLWIRLDSIVDQGKQAWRGK